MTNPLVERLRKLTSLPDQDLRALEAEFCPVRTGSGHVDLLMEGQSPNHLHVILDGWACRYRLLPNGQRQLPALLLPGDLCDLDGFLLRRLHYGVAALTPCTVAALPHARLRAMLDKHPAVRDAFWWLTSVDNAMSAEWSVSLGRRSALERAAHLVCELLERLAAVGLTDGDSFAFPITQTELGDALGITSVHVNRTLHELRSRDLMAIEGRRIIIRDLEGLKEVAGFNADHLHLDGMRDSRRALSH